MIDHTGVSVSDFAVSKAFYSKALKAIGYELVYDLSAELTGHGAAAGFGVPPKPDFWIGGGRPNVPPIHVAFRAARRWTLFIGPRSRPADATTAPRVCGRTITPITTAPSCWIRMATTSKRCATNQPDAGAVLKRRRCCCNATLVFRRIGAIHTADV
jgi:hypothetical protein